MHKHYKTIHISDRKKVNKRKFTVYCIGVIFFSSAMSLPFFPKNSQRIPKEFSKNSLRIPIEFPKNSDKIPKAFPKIPQKFPRFWKYPIPYIAKSGISRGSERYQIDPKWLRGSLMFIKEQFGIIHNLQMSPIPFFAVSYSKPALVYFLDHQQYNLSIT